MSNKQISLRLDAKLKNKADAILSQLGLSTSDFTRMALHQLVLQNGIPFETRVPNEETRMAIDEAQTCKRRFPDANALLAHLGE